MDTRLYEDVDDMDFSVDDLADRRRHGSVVMADPRHFDVSYELADNRFMDESYDVDQALAQEQWEHVKAAYEDVGCNVRVIAGDDDTYADLPDSVFTANHGVTYHGDGVEKIVMSTMAHPEREDEVAYAEQFFTEQGYEIHTVDHDYRFEGSGDAIWHPEKELLWAGHGIRTDQEAYDTVIDAFDVPAISLELGPETDWYHLDTCFAPITADTALAYMDDLPPESQDKILSVFGHDGIIAVPEEEAVDGLAANAHSPDGETVILNAGNPQTEAALEDAGFAVNAVDTSEFTKSGGSVYCMKLTAP